MTTRASSSSFSSVTSGLTSKPDPTPQAKVLHMELVDHPSNVGTRHSRLFAECGRYFYVWEFAPHVDYVTCPRCKAELNFRETTDI